MYALRVELNTLLVESITTFLSRESTIVFAAMRYCLNQKTNSNQDAVGQRLALVKKKAFAIYEIAHMVWSELKYVVSNVMPILVMFLMMGRLQRERDIA